MPQAPGWLARPEAKVRELNEGSASSSSPPACFSSAPRSARPTGSTASSASGRLRRKVGMVEMIRLADEPWAPVAQGHPGAEVVRSVRVALRGTNVSIHPAAG